VFLARHADTPTGVGEEDWSLMTETLKCMSSVPKEATKTLEAGEAERTGVPELVKAARARGEDLTGPNGLLKLITKQVLESALEEEMTEHLATASTRRRPMVRATSATEPAQDGPNGRSGEVPRDPAGTFSPVIVKKGQRRLTDVDAVAISLYAKGLTTGEISGHFAEVYGASISKDTISRITDKVVEEMQAWASRPLQACTRRSDRRDLLQGPRRAGRQPAVLRRDRGRLGRAPRRARSVGRKWWR